MKKVVNPYTLLLVGVVTFGYYFGIPLLFSDDNELNPINNDKASASYESRFAPPPLPKSLSQDQTVDNEGSKKIKAPKQSLESWQKNYVETQVHSTIVRKQVSAQAKKTGKIQPKEPRRVMIQGTELKKSASIDQNNSQKINQRVASRWIPQLSGQRAGIDLVKHGKTLKGCPPDSEACADKNSKPDHVSVVGVVVDTGKIDNSNRSMSGEPILKGNVQTGNYAENTPAIYVQ